MCDTPRFNEVANSDVIRQAISQQALQPSAPPLLPDMTPSSATTSHPAPTQPQAILAQEAPVDTATSLLPASSSVHSPPSSATASCLPPSSSMLPASQAPVAVSVAMASETPLAPALAPAAPEGLEDE